MGGGAAGWSPPGGSGAPRPHEDWEEKPIELGDYINVLWRRWRTVAGAAGTVFVLAAAYSLLATRIYEARTTLQVGEEPPLTFLGDLQMLQPQADPVLSELEILKSRTVAEGAVRKAGLQVRLLPDSGGLRIDVEVMAPESSRPGAIPWVEGRVYTIRRCPCSPDVAVVHGPSPSEGPEASVPAGTAEAGKGTGPPSEAGPPAGRAAQAPSARPDGPAAPRCFEIVDDLGQSVGRGVFGRPFLHGDWALAKVDDVPGEGDQVSFEVVEFGSAVRSLRTRTSVTTKRNTNIVEVAVRAESPAEAQRSANEIVSSYIQNTVDRQTGQAKSTKDFIGDQIKTVAGELGTLESELRRLQSDEGIVSFSEETRRVLDTWIQEESNRARLQAQRELAQAILDMLKAPDTPDRPKEISTAGIDNPVLADLATRLTGLELRRVQLSQGYAARHSTVLELDAQIAEARRQLTQELEGTLNGLDKALEAAGNVLGEYDLRMRGLPEAEYKLATALRDSKVKESLYTLLLQKRQEAEITSSSTIGTAWQIDRAILDPRPVHPRILRNLVLGILLGVFLGVGLAFLQEHLDRSVRTVSDIERCSGLATFGLIPDIQEPRPSRASPTNGSGPRSSSRARKLVHRLGLQGFAAEAYRTLRTNVQFALPGAKTACILVTSPGPGEGKSLTCANMAVVLGSMGRRVLVVDADLRRPVQHRFFELERGRGLSDVLAGTASWQDVVLETGVENVRLIAGGHLPPNPAELLSRGNLEDLLGDLSAHHDVVIVDSPPVIPFTDASVIARHVLGAFLVVRAGVTTPEAVARARAMLDGVGARTLGAILNGVSLEQGFGLPGYYRYYYGYYYNRDDTDSERDASGIPRWLPRPLREWLRCRGRKRRPRTVDGGGNGSGRDGGAPRSGSAEAPPVAVPAPCEPATGSASEKGPSEPAGADRRAIPGGGAGDAALYPGSRRRKRRRDRALG